MPVPLAPAILESTDLVDAFPDVKTTLGMVGDSSRVWQTVAGRFRTSGGYARPDFADSRAVVNTGSGNGRVTIYPYLFGGEFIIFRQKDKFNYWYVQLAAEWELRLGRVASTGNVAVSTVDIASRPLFFSVLFDSTLIRVYIESNASSTISTNSSIFQYETHHGMGAGFDASIDRRIDRWEYDT